MQQQQNVDAGASPIFRHDHDHDHHHHPSISLPLTSASSNSRGCRGPMEFLTFCSTSSSSSSAACLPPSSDSDAALFLRHHHLFQYSHPPPPPPPSHHNINIIYPAAPFLPSDAAIPPDLPAPSLRAPDTTTTTEYSSFDDIEQKQQTSCSSSSGSSTIEQQQQQQHHHLHPHHPPPPLLILHRNLLHSDRSADVQTSKSVDDLQPLDHSSDPHAGCRSSGSSISSSISSSSSAAAAAAAPAALIQTVDACAATVCEMNRAVNSSAAASHCAINSCDAMPYDYNYNTLLQGGHCGAAAAVSSPNGGSAGNGRVGKSRSAGGMIGGGTGDVVAEVVMMEDTAAIRNKRRKKRKRGGDGNGDGDAAAAASLQNSATAAKNSKKNREELEHQRMTHIAVERNRRRQMNIHLAALRSIMPSSYVQRGDQASIVGGAIRFVEELEQLVQCLHLQKQLRAQNNNVDQTTTTTSGRNMAIPEDDDQHQYDHFQMVDTSTITQLVHFPNVNDGSCNNVNPQLDMDDTSTFHLLREGSYAASSSPIASIEVNIISPSTIFLKVLAPKKPHQLLHTISALTTLYLKVMQLNVTAMDSNTILFSFNLQMDADYQLQTPNELVEVIQNILGAHDDGRCEHIITF